MTESWLNLPMVVAPVIFTERKGNHSSCTGRGLKITQSEMAAAA